MIDITVVIPAYNAEKTIGTCFYSVYSDLISTKYSFEIIIVNDGSTDSTLELLAEIQERYKPNVLIHNQKNAGVSVARNTGLKMARGRYIAFCDSDDQWVLGKIQIQMAYITIHDDVSMVAGVFDRDNINAVKRMEMENVVGIKEQIFKNYFAIQTVLFKREVLEKVGLFNPSMRYMEDFLFISTMIYHYKCVLLNQKMAESIEGKNRWGQSGLSAKLVKMELGELYSISYMYKKGWINLPLYFCALCFSVGKFCRRTFMRLTRSLKRCRMPVSIFLLSTEIYNR